LEYILPHQQYPCRPTQKMYLPKTLIGGPGFTFHITLICYYQVKSFVVMLSQQYRPFNGEIWSWIQPGTFMYLHYLAACTNITFFPRTIRLWNELPTEIKDAPTVPAFASGLNKFYAF